MCSRFSSWTWMLLAIILYLIPWISPIAGALETQECSEVILSSGIPLYCPSSEDPEKTDCCYDKGVPSCCKFDDYAPRLVMAVALAVISACCLLTVMILVCCFCPRCLLYDSCRSNYANGEVIAYAKEEEMTLHSAMPPEDEEEKTSYSTKSIKIKPIADV